MPLYKKTDRAPEKSTAVITIYGEPGCFKTSLALTAKNPVLIDFDGGLWRAYGIDQKDKFIAEKGWMEVEQAINEGAFEEYDTIICDTVKTALDNYLAALIMEENPGMKSVGGGLTMQGYGALSVRFKEQFIRKFPGKVLVFIAHEKEEMESDFTTCRPDITGATYGIIMQISDQVMWLTKENDKVVMHSENSGKYISKNTAKLKAIELPNCETKEWADFFQREVIDKVINAMSLSVKKTGEEQSKAMDYAAIINGFEDVLQLNHFLADTMPILKKSPAMKALVVDVIKKKADKMGWERDKTTDKDIVAFKVK